MGKSGRVFMKRLQMSLMAAVLFLFGSVRMVEAGGGWIVYWDGSYHGKVIDAETKEPIEGAVVMAVYTADCYRFIQTNSKTVGAQEVLTKADGTFQIPSFWTISTPDCWYSHTHFMVFKPGYGSFPRHHTQVYLPEKPKMEREPDIFKMQDMLREGIVVELPRLKSREERLNLVPHSGDPFSNHKEWKKHYLRLLNIERMDLGLDPVQNEN